MNEQEYFHIRNLACDLLIDSKTSRLPVCVYEFASTFNLVSLVDITKHTYDNMVAISKKILEMYGYSNNIENSNELAVRILAPFIVLRELGIETAEEMSCITELPLEICFQSFMKFNALLDKITLEFSPIEKKTLKQFIPWIEESKRKYGVH